MECQPLQRDENLFPTSDFWTKLEEDFVKREEKEVSSWETPARKYAKGIGDAVADRTVNRKKPDGTIETWEDVAYRVALGNTMLNQEDAPVEFELLHKHLRQASILLSGRHLQHGDETQPQRNQEVFTNCSTAASSFILFYLLLNGSGVGRAYDDDMMVVDWAGKMPKVMTIIRENHPDVVSGEISADYAFDGVRPLAEELMGQAIVYTVPDTREGWAKAVEQIEYLTWEGTNHEKTLVLDFSQVRERGAPIGGMQNRPASGPGPLMHAINGIAKLRANGMEPWESTLNVDHLLSECVLVGGARRAARMATKTWRDKSVVGFVKVKRGGVLWSSNNSVTVDQEFWEGARLGETKIMEAEAAMMINPSEETVAVINDSFAEMTDLQKHAFTVFAEICDASYHDGTGEPGLINVDKLTQKQDHIEQLFDGDYAHSSRFQLDDRSKDMTAQIAHRFASKKYTQITNPCGEISLAMLGGYCVIADVVPFHADSALDEEWDDEAEEAFRTAVRALIRVNTMDCLYSKEVKRTNRIGVGFTGLHEYAWARFGYGWKDIVNEERSLPFWRMMARFSNACVQEARKYSAKLGVNMPHTVTTVKPAGTTSKLFGLTEGAHLPSMREYLRWVQFRNDDPLIAEYAAKGYPVRELKTYKNTTVVGFPTSPTICSLGMGDALVTAAEATPEEQYEYLRLLEKYWLAGYDDGATHDFGNQVSYTLKYKPEVTNYEEFRRTLLEGQSTIKACSVMPQTDASAYEYQPEQPIAKYEYNAMLAAIKEDDDLKQDIGFEHVDCGGGACPIDFSSSKVA